MTFELANLFRRKNRPEFGAFVLLHLHADFFHITLHRLCNPGYLSTSSHLWPTAPEEWFLQQRQKCYARAKSMGERIGMVNDKFPNYQPSNWSWILLVFCSIRNQLVFLNLSGMEAYQEGTHDETHINFEAMLAMLQRMCPCFLECEDVIQDLLDSLAQHGYTFEKSVGNTSR